MHTIVFGDQGRLIKFCEQNKDCNLINFYKKFL